MHRQMCGRKGSISSAAEALTRAAGGVPGRAVCINGSGCEASDKWSAVKSQLEQESGGLSSAPRDVQAAASPPPSVQRHGRQ